MPMQITSVSKSFGVDLILDNISMNIADNEKIGLIGANGAGKTTLLRIISGELGYDSGSIFTPKDSEIGFLKQNAVEESENTMWEDVMEIFSDVTSLETELRSLEQKWKKRHMMKNYMLSLWTITHVCRLCLMQRGDLKFIHVSKRLCPVWASTALICIIHVWLL